MPCSIPLLALARGTGLLLLIRGQHSTAQHSTGQAVLPLSSGRNPESLSCPAPNPFASLLASLFPSSNGSHKLLVPVQIPAMLHVHNLCFSKVPCLPVSPCAGPALLLG
jgi:hypothetical protein